jgi:hypothetical protein
VSPYEIATLYANLGDKQSAFKWLDVAYQGHKVVAVDKLEKYRAVMIEE